MTANQQGRCPLCGWDAKVAQLGDADRVDCELCGKFKITGSLLSTAVADKDKGLRPYLSAHTRQASERGEIVTLNTNNWKDFALAHKGTPVSRKVTKLLELVASRCGPGQTVQITPQADWPLVDGESKQRCVSF